MGTVIRSCSDSYQWARWLGAVVIVWWACSSVTRQLGSPGHTTQPCGGPSTNLSMDGHRHNHVAGPQQICQWRDAGTWGGQKATFQQMQFVNLLLLLYLSSYNHIQYTWLYTGRTGSMATICACFSCDDSDSKSVCSSMVLCVSTLHTKCRTRIWSSRMHKAHGIQGLEYASEFCYMILAAVSRPQSWYQCENGKDWPDDKRLRIQRVKPCSGLAG